MSIMGDSHNKWLQEHEPESISVMGSGLVEWSLPNQELPPGADPYMQLLDIQEMQGRFKQLRPINAGESEINLSVIKPDKSGQSPVCKLIPDDSVTGMINMVVESDKIIKEMGAAFKPDLSLSGASTGTENQVKIKRPKNAIGTFHTQTNSVVIPSQQDVLDALAKKDNVFCVGANRLNGVEVNCYTPVEPLWSQYREKMIALLTDLNSYYQDISNRYGISHRKWNEEKHKYEWAPPVIGQKVRAPSLRRLLKYIASPAYISGIKDLRPQDMTIIEVNAVHKMQIASRASEQVAITEDKVIAADETVIRAQSNYDEALRVNSNQLPFIELELYRAEAEAKRMRGQLESAKRISDDADAEYQIARVKSYITPGDIEEGRKNAVWATDRLRKGSDLEVRRTELLNELHDHVLLASYKPGERTNKQLAITKCNLVGGEEELPYEL